MTKRQKQTSVYPLRLPTSLKTAVREVSRRDGTSINQFVTTAVAGETLRHAHRGLLRRAPRPGRHRRGPAHPAAARR